MAINSRKARTPMPRVHPEVRRRTFTEVARGYSEWQAVAEANRCSMCRTTPCASGCPMQVDVPTFIAQMADGEFESAFRTLTESCALPGICGRVCRQDDHCEACCGAGASFDPIAIGRLERFVSDWAAARGILPITRPATTKGVSTSEHRIAIVGSGPAGLAAAADLARLGYAVTIFEAHDKPGGMMTYGIPEFRLPKAVVQREIDQLQRAGVEIKTSCAIGRRITVDDLFARLEYDAVFLAAGAAESRRPDIPGIALKGVYSANEYLTMARLVNESGLGEMPTPPMHGSRVLVIGGGDTAFDVARTAIRLGAVDAKVVYRRTRAEMRARSEEVAHAVEEGVQMVCLATPIELCGDAIGRVRSVRFREMRLGPRDASGRRSPTPIPDADFTLEATVAVFATGASADPMLRLAAPGLHITDSGHVAADAGTGATEMKGLFAGGHVVSGSATVTEAMAAGRRAARAIHQYLQGPLPDGC